MSVLANDMVRGLVLQAWLDSQPGTGNAHEEGGFVLRSADGSLSVERWPRGAQNEIFVPQHPSGTEMACPSLRPFTLTRIQVRTFNRNRV